MKSSKPKAHALSVSSPPVPSSARTDARPSTSAGVVGSDIAKYDVNDPEFIEAFRSMRTVPVANVRKSVMVFDDQRRKHIFDDALVEEASKMTETKNLAADVPRKRRVPPLPVRLRALNNTRYDELSHDMIIGKDLSSASSTAALSPRSIILRECIEQKIIPFAIKEILIDSYVKQKKLNITRLAQVEIVENNIVRIDLHDLGLGDEKGCIFASALPLLDKVRALNVSGNRFTDKALTPILSATLRHLRCCTSLDVSDNKLDDSSIDILKADLRHSTCRLQRLHLSKCDIDDIECASLLTSLHNNKSLVFLDLSHNRIGEMEEYNTVNPDFITGGESIAEMLLNNDCLLELDLSWNNIRKDSARTLVDLLASNNNLRKLSLAHNNLGDLVGQALGMALVSNAALTSLDISFNNILPHGITVIAHALERNEVLQVINLNGNSLGERGARSIMRAVRLVAATGRILKVLFENSNLHYVSNVLNRSEPSGVYSMDLENPYDYTVVCILYEIANANLASIFKNMKHLPKNSQKWRRISLHRASSSVAMGSVLQLVPAIAKALKTYDPSMPSMQLVEMLDSLMHILGFDPSDIVLRNVVLHLHALSPARRSTLHIVLRTIFLVVFRLADTTSCGSVDAVDVEQCFRLMQNSTMVWPCNPDHLWSADDFVQSMLLQFTEIIPPSPPPLIDQSTRSSWVPPRSGQLTFTFEFESLPPCTGELSSDEGLQNLVHAVREGASSQQGVAKAMQLAVCNDLYLSSEQAQRLLGHAVDNKKDSLTIVKEFLPQLSSPLEACKFLTLNLAYDEILAIRASIGHVFKALTGNSCGFYLVDLSVDEDVQLLKRLNAINCLDKNRAIQESSLRNTSQAGDWECFRNEKLNGKSVRLDSNFFYNLPSAGRLQLDFVSCTRPASGVRPVSDARLTSILSSIFGPIILLNAESAERKNETSQIPKPFARRMSRASSVLDESVLFPVESFKSLWSHYFDCSWDSLKRRYSDVLYDKIEEAKVGMNRFLDDPGKAFQSAVYTKIYKDARSEPMYKVRKLVYQSSASATADSPTEMSRLGSPSSPPISRHGHGKDRFSDAAAGRSTKHPSKAERDIAVLDCASFEGSIQKLEAHLCYNVWFTVNQVRVIVKKFSTRRAPVGVLCRVICTLFSRIIDLENFGHLMNEVDSALKLELIHRLGILNVWSPIVPDGHFEMDLAAWDHREAVKLFIRLAVIEPGENILDESYSPSLIEPAIPGWELPISWTEDDAEGKGPSNYGFLTFTYSSEPSRGCSVVWAAREELTFARCLAGSKGSFIRGLNVRPKSRMKKIEENETDLYARLTSDSLFDSTELYESASDLLNEKAKDVTVKYFGHNAKFQRAPGKF